MRKIHIMCGLPGSGKSTLARLIKKSLDDIYVSSRIFSFDKKTEACLINFISSNDTEHGIIDGLFTTNEDYARLLELIKKHNGYSFVNVQFHFFNENRELCLKNDSNRRDIGCKASIKNMRLEEPNIKLLSNKFNMMAINKTNYDVYDYNALKSFKEKYDIPEYSEVIRSQTWSNPGSHGNCWDDEISYYGGETPLASFEEFDVLIEKINPNISFIQYKKLYNKCVSINDKVTFYQDYYGGSGESTSAYECDIKKLFSMLVEMGLINIE